MKYRNIKHHNSRTNALVVFSMIDNLDEVTFAFRNSKSDGKLDEYKYNTTFTFPRKAFEEKYGDLSALGENLDLLEKTLTGKIAEAKEAKQDISPEEKQRQAYQCRGEISHGEGSEGLDISFFFGCSRSISRLTSSSMETRLFRELLCIRSRKDLLSFFK